MIGANNGDVEHAREDMLGTIVDTVRCTALELIASLPERPTRLRVRAAGVTVDLDWRSVPAPASPVAPAAPSAAPPNGLADQAGPPAAPGEPDQSVAETSRFVCAPAIGTFYQAPEPGKPPFVTPGDLVEVGQQVGIIEAMKLMLPVEADCAGQVIRVLVTDGQAVEYGDQLIELGPAD